MNAIEIDSLYKTFRGKKRARVEAVRDLNLAVKQGEVFGFLGPNGAGKSTTIKTLVGLIKPTSGQARIMGEDISNYESRRKVGYLPENPAFYEYLTAQEYLDFVGKSFGLSGNRLREKRDQVLHLLELWDARKRPMRGYSKGMVQRVGLAQVLIHDPDVYILDEPMSGLDPLGRALVKEIMLDLRERGKTVFFSTHVTADVEAVCDRVGVIVEGLLHEPRSVDEIMDKGIEGYRIQLKECRDEAFAGFERLDKCRSGVEFYIPRQQLDPFMSEVKACQVEISLIEPKRKNLEAFFLEIVKQSS